VRRDACFYVCIGNEKEIGMGYYSREGGREGGREEGREMSTIASSRRARARASRRLDSSKLRE
jgi:hypothetical protein